MSNANKFLALFNDLEKYLNDLARLDRHQDFMTIVSRLSDKNRVIWNYKNDLREYSELRNAIVHQSKGKPIAEPYDETIEEFQKIVNRIKKPPTVYDIASKPVFTSDINDLIVDVVKIMTERVYTNIPITENGRFAGVFSESVLTRWLGESAEKDGFLLQATKIGELKKYFDQENDSFCCYKFVNRKVDVFTIKDEFLSFVNQIKRLGSIFVTENGKKEESILGIITSWDLPKIDEYGK